MYAFIARLALVAMAGKLFARMSRHPKLAPVLSTRKGRMALLALGWGMRRHPRTRIAGHTVKKMMRYRRGAI